MNYLGTLLSSFNQKYSFTIKEEELSQDYSNRFKLYKGIKSDKEITVFILDLKRNPQLGFIGKNAYKKLKSIKFPSILSFVDGVEEDDKIIICTEYVTPLSRNLLDSNFTNDSLLWGLYSIGKSVEFLTKQGIIHGNLNITSVFITRSGEWKLSGLELSSSNVEEFLHNMQNTGSSRDFYLPREIFERNFSGSANKDQLKDKIDSYGFGVLIYQIHNGNFSRREDLLNRGKIPLNLYEIYKRLIEDDPRRRLSLKDFMEIGERKGGFFDNPLIWTSKFLEEFQIKEPWEKEEFLRKIQEVIHLLPIEFSKFKVLPELLKAVEFGGAGANALGSTLKLGSKLSSEEFNSLILPTVINLFSSQDKNIKSCLYENLESIIQFIPEKVVNDKLFPSLSTGFNDENPSIREQALKSVLHVAPKLNDRNINTELFRYLSKLQTDPQPGIRTNTTICIGKLSKLFNATTQKRVLAHTFLKALGDPFPPSRVAGLLAFSATADYYEPEEISSKILPVFSRLLLDPEKNVREQAFKNMHTFLKILQTHSDSMPEIKPVPAPSASQSQTQAVRGDSIQKSSQGSGWGDWALNTVATKMAGTALDLEPTVSSNSAASYNPPKVSPSISSQSNSSYTSQTHTKSNGIGGTMAATNTSPSKNSFASSASKPLVLSNKKDSDFGWDQWTDDSLVGDAKLPKNNGSVGLGPVLQPERPKKSTNPKKSPVNSRESMLSNTATGLGPGSKPESQKPSHQSSYGHTKELTMNGWSDEAPKSSIPQKSTGYGNETTMTSWAKGNDDWGWEDKTDTFPKKKSSIDASRTTKINSTLKTDDWNVSPGDDWNSWAEPTTPSQIQRKESNDWGSWGETGTTSISIDKIKGENRKQTLQDSKPKSSRIAGKKY